MDTNRLFRDLGVLAAIVTLAMGAGTLVEWIEAQPPAFLTTVLAIVGVTGYCVMRIAGGLVIDALGGVRWGRSVLSAICGNLVVLPFVIVVILHSALIARILGGTAISALLLAIVWAAKRRYAA